MCKPSSAWLQSSLSLSPPKYIWVLLAVLPTTHWAGLPCLKNRQVHRQMDLCSRCPIKMSLVTKLFAPWNCWAGALSPYLPSERNVILSYTQLIGSHSDFASVSEFQSQRKHLFQFPHSPLLKSTEMSLELVTAAKLCSEQSFFFDSRASFKVEMIVLDAILSHRNSISETPLSPMCMTTARVFIKLVFIWMPVMGKVQILPSLGILSKSLFLNRHK